MARYAQTSLTAGELSPKMIGRADVARFAAGCARGENAVIDPTGLWSVRGGFSLRGAAKYPDRAHIMRRFQYSNAQSYVLEFGDLYVRFWKDGGAIEDPGNPGNPLELATPWAEADLADLKFAQSLDVLYVFCDRFQTRTLNRFAHDDWTLELFETRDGPYLPENPIDAHVVSIAGASGSVTVTFSGSGNAPLTGTSADVGRHIRIKDVADDNKWKWIKITAPSSTTVCTGTVMSAAFSGALSNVPAWRLGLLSAATGWPSCGAIFDQRLVIAGVPEQPDGVYGSVIANYDWFKPDGTGSDSFGFALATSDAQKVLSLVPGSDLVVLTEGQPHRLSGDGERTTITPTNVVARPLAKRGAAAVQAVPVDLGTMWFDPQRRKVIELRYLPDTGGYALEDLTLLADHLHGGGFTEMDWQLSPLPTMWIARDDGLGVSMAYSRNENVLGFMRHVFGGGARLETLCVIPTPTGDELWAGFRRVKADGSVWRSIERYEPVDELLDPLEAQLRLDGAFSFDSTPAAALRLAALSGNVVAVETSADVFVSGDVGRRILHRVRLDNDAEDARPEDDNLAVYQTGVAQIIAYIDARHVTVKVLAPFTSLDWIDEGDWRLTVTQITGLAHHAGETISAQLDGRPVHGLAVSAGGVLDLPFPAGTVHGGWRYRGFVRSLPLDASGAPAQGQGRKGRVPGVVLRVLRSLGGKLTHPNGSWDRIGQPVSFAPSKPPALINDDIEVRGVEEWKRRLQVTIVQDEPLPLNVALIVPNLYQPFVQP